MTARGAEIRTHGGRSACFDFGCRHPSPLISVSNAPIYMRPELASMRHRMAIRIM